MKTLNAIGCGHVGQTLARMWALNKVFRVQSILNSSLASSQRAADFVGQGRAVDSYTALGPADVIMISARDQSIAACCRQLVDGGLLQPGTVVFHCSGSLPSSLLGPASDRGAHVASIHPVKSFADPVTAVATFRGTFCAIEGHPDACRILREAVQPVGGRPFAVEPGQKGVYHAASVFACNYLVALLEVSYRCFQQAGIDRDTAAELMRPMVSETIDNVFQLGPVRALTGPIARGETSVVARQCDALADWDEAVHRVYQALGHWAVELASRQGNATIEELARIRQRLGSHQGPDFSPDDGNPTH